MSGPVQSSPVQSHYSGFYSGEFYDWHINQQQYDCSHKLVNLVRKFVNFNSVIDLGCAVGQILRACIDTGSDCVAGVDGEWVDRSKLVIPQDKFFQYDITIAGLNEKLPAKRFDLTISSEVAEHLDEKDSDVYMDNLTSFSDVILFSAAIPGQIGTHHVNEQWPSYWIKKFNERGFIPVDCIRPLIWNDEIIYVWYKQNLMFFVKKDSLENYPDLAKYSDWPCLDLVHPKLFESRASVSKPGFKATIKNILPSFLRAIKKRIVK